MDVRKNLTHISLSLLNYLIASVVSTVVSLLLVLQVYPDPVKSVAAGIVGLFSGFIYARLMNYGLE